MATVLSVMVKKGGTSKSTTAVNLSAALQQLGNRVLLVDLDSQANATERLFAREAPQGQAVGDGIANLDLHARLTHYLHPTGWKNLDLLPANSWHTTIEKNLPEDGEALKGLKYLVEAHGDKWDWVIIDCPNNFHSLTLNAFCASNGVIVPVDLDDEGSIRAIPSVMNTINIVQQEENPDLSLWGILLTKYGPQTSLVQASWNTLKEDLKMQDLIFKTRIPKSQHIKNANALRIPAVFKFPNNALVQQYNLFAKEVLHHERSPKETVNV